MANNTTDMIPVRANNLSVGYRDLLSTSEHKGQHRELAQAFGNVIVDLGKTHEFAIVTLERAREDLASQLLEINKSMRDEAKEEKDLTRRKLIVDSWKEIANATNDNTIGGIVKLFQQSVIANENDKNSHFQVIERALETKMKLIFQDEMSLKIVIEHNNALLKAKKEEQELTHLDKKLTADFDERKKKILIAQYDQYLIAYKAELDLVTRKVLEQNGQGNRGIFAIPVVGDVLEGIKALTGLLQNSDVQLDLQPPTIDFNTYTVTPGRVALTKESQCNVM